ncbi:MAG: O-methyltransferase ctb2 [Bogoriella megaspora]|nr:MAG: O-methyltransferase ctb2 [Bogoriella megaspora]
MKGTNNGRIDDSELYELAAEILSSSASLNKFLKKRKLAPLSFNNPAPNIPLSPENAAYHESKAVIIEAAERLIDLVRGPRDILVELSFQHCASASLRVILRYGLHHHVPLTGATTYTQIADAAGNGVTPALCERILQHAMSFGLFVQAPCGHVAHNNVSSLLVTDPDLEAWVYLCMNIAYPAGVQIPQAVEKYGVSSEANESAYGISIGRKISQFERFREPDGHNDHEMFAKAMRGISAGGAYDVSHVVDGGFVGWEELDTRANTLLVDVGGGPGHVAMALARKYPTIRFEVQDLPETVEVGARNCPEELKSRFTFRAHDFFKTQPKHEISGDESVAYFARFILHDWSDKYARQIVEALAKGMRPQDRLILNEVVVPEPGEMARQIERKCHDRDLLMLMNLNGRERTLSAFKALLQSVTPKLRVERVYRPPQGELSLIEAVLDSQENGGVNGVNGFH